MKQTRTLIFILVIFIITIWVDWPGTRNIDFLGIKQEIYTHLGLDLIGGAQVLLEAKPSEGQTVDAAVMDNVRTIIENRVNSMGVNEAVVSIAGDRRIVVELPGVEDPETAKATIKETALLEFVDMTRLTYDQANQLKETNAFIHTTASEIRSGQSLSGSAAFTGTVWTTVMTGDKLEDAVAYRDPNSGAFEVQFKLTSEGSQIFSAFTTAHQGEVLAIVLDNHIISAPTINQAITSGQGSITGQFSLAEVQKLAVQLKYGALPVALEEAETRAVGPTLGQDSLQKSLLAGLIGSIIVFLFMALYYRLPGLVADLAIILYALITLALFRIIPVTLTLPGIAGFLLSTGSALDANILIFERMKEELRDGRTLLQAIDQGWQRAWPSIRDSNIATLLTCSILWFFGSATGATIVKGFSLTLAVGVGVSLFTAIVVSRTLLSAAVTWLKPTNLGRWFGI